MPEMKQKIVPSLWFDRHAEEAAKLYASLFANSRVERVIRATKAGFEFHGIPDGQVLTVEFKIEGFRFVGINGGPIFKPNPSISFFVSCRSRDEVDRIWARLKDGGQVRMELGEYPFSQRYGWVDDKYGFSWQLGFSPEAADQKVTPTLLFVGPQCGKAEAAARMYTGVFRNSSVGEIMRYGKGEEPEREGSVRYMTFTLEGQRFSAMDSALAHNFGFNEAVSLMVECENQSEIDHYWEGLTRDGGEEGQCGWLKDRFGVSWQVAPRLLAEMLAHREHERVERVTNAYLRMKKFDIAALERAFRGETAAEVR